MADPLASTRGLPERWHAIHNQPGKVPNWLVHLAALRDPSIKQIIPELGNPKNATSAKARRVLGWAPRTNEEAIVATAESLLRLGLLKESPDGPRRP